MGEIHPHVSPFNTIGLLWKQMMVILRIIFHNRMCIWVVKTNGSLFGLALQECLLWGPIELCESPLHKESPFNFSMHFSILGIPGRPRQSYSIGWAGVTIHIISKPERVSSLSYLVRKWAALLSLELRISDVWYLLKLIVAIIQLLLHARAWVQMKAGKKHVSTCASV